MFVLTSTMGENYTFANQKHDTHFYCLWARTSVTVTRNS